VPKPSAIERIQFSDASQPGDRPRSQLRPTFAYRQEIPPHVGPTKHPDPRTPASGFHRLGYTPTGRSAEEKPRKSAPRAASIGETPRSPCRAATPNLDLDDFGIFAVRHRRERLAGVGLRPLAAALAPTRRVPIRDRKRKTSEGDPTAWRS